MKQKLKCLSEKTTDELFKNVQDNIERYKAGDFADLENTYGWSVELQVYVDLGPLNDLDGNKGSANEIKNSLLVWQALSDLTPSLACENRIWTRLSHVEGLKFARERWLKTDSDDEVIKSVKDHFFADKRTKWRDDNALSRLWWNAYIAAQVSVIDQKEALGFILGKADIRLNFVERPWISSRPKLAASIIRVMINDTWIIDKEENFRSLMRQINKYGGGVLYESWQDTEVDDFIIKCVSLAKSLS